MDTNIRISNSVQAIGFCGPMFSGKDTAAGPWLDGSNFRKLALADPMKQDCVDAGTMTPEEAWITKPAAKRALLQWYGTGIRRSSFDDFWLARWALAYMEGLRFSSNPLGLFRAKDPGKGVATTDIRFPNEVDFKVNRLRVPVVFIKANRETQLKRAAEFLSPDELEKASQHSSESHFAAILKEYNGHPLFWQVENNGTLESFRDKCAQLNARHLTLLNLR